MFCSTFLHLESAKRLSFSLTLSVTAFPESEDVLTVNASRESYAKAFRSDATLTLRPFTNEVLFRPFGNLATIKTKEEKP